MAYPITSRVFLRGCFAFSHPNTPASMPQSNDSEQKAKQVKPVKLNVKGPHADYFQPMLTAMSEKKELNEVIKNRVEKGATLMEQGVALHPNNFRKSTDLRDIERDYASYDAEKLETVDRSFRVAGRVVGLRSFGKAAFFHLRDTTGELQVFLQKSDLDAATFALFKKIDLGDHVGVAGSLFRTKTGELTLKASELVLLSKSMRPLPEKYHGLKDVEIRYRQRYVDLIVTPQTREIFRKRTRIIREMRSYLDAHGFMEMETPMMQSIPGGATAKPFETHHNALDMHLFMRIAPELYLKRLLVGGFEKVYEIGKNFRNEGISTQHNPEFTMCEFYWAYATYKDLMDLTEKLFAQVAQAVCGSAKVMYQGTEIDMTPGKWKRVKFLQSLEEIGGLSPDLYTDYDKAAAFVKQHGEKVLESDRLGKVQAKLFDLFVEPKLIQPTFVYHYPTDISPLSRANDEDPSVTDRFELFICGREMANAFTELNDPVDQRIRFEEQVRERKGGDDEAHCMDEDYLRALEYGMPPAAGQGIGIDRLVMLLTDSASIREVILFPLLRPEA